MTSNQTTAGSVAAFLVVTRHVIAAQDIAQTIRDEVSDARVMICPDETGAVSALQNVEAVALSFVSSDPAHFAGSELCRQLRIRGSRIVLMGEEAEARGATAEWEVLPWPFNTSAVVALLRGAQPSGGLSTLPCCT